MKLRFLLRGLATYRPGWRPAEPTGGTDSARYCYAVWMRHLLRARDAGVLGAPPAVPRVVAELGPGDSIGIGLAALLTGVERYDAFDVVRHAEPARNLAVMDALAELVAGRAAIPDHHEFPGIVPRLPDYRFPADLLPAGRLEDALAPSRVARLRAALARPEGDGALVTYRVPWNDATVLRRGSVDMVFSQAVLEHVEDLAGTHAAVHAWLRTGGFASHAIDYRSHAFSGEWNGHWTYSDLEWTLVRGRRPYLLNREPHSVHVRRLADAGFDLVEQACVRRSDGAPPSRLARRFRDLSADDRETSSAFVIAVKR